MPLVIEFTIAVLLSLALSLSLNRVMLSLAPRLGLMDEPGERRIHSKPIPRAGGIAIWLSFMLVVCGILATRWLGKSEQLSWSWMGAFAAGSGILLVAGFLDDRKGLTPWVKLGAHILAPTVFFLLHPVHTGIFPDGWPPVYDYVVFVGWVVVLINAFNLIDGLDGLCGGLAAVSSVALAALAFFNGRPDSALIMLVMGGAIVGFLKYNINPARIFLGDAGSMLLGFFLATAATEAVGRKAVVGVILLPIAVAGVPLLDGLLAIWRRGARRLILQLQGEKVEGGIFAADSKHLHHRMLESGNSQRKVALALQGMAILLAALAFLPMIFGDRVLGLSLVGLLVVGLVGIKNLARVEIAKTGNVIHMAIKQPGHRRRVAAVLFVYDLLVLTAAGVSAVIVETNRLEPGASLENLTRFVVVFIILGIFSLQMARVHPRLWVRATIGDVLTLQFWLLVAAIGTFTLFSLLYSQLEWSALRLMLLSYVFASAGICLPRVALSLLRELGFEARHRSPQQEVVGGYGPVVVVGAGDLGTLLLDHLQSIGGEVYPGMRLLGFIDEAEVLHGRRLRSFTILGGLSILPKLVEEEGLKGIILAISAPSAELMLRLEALSARYDLKIHRWQVGIGEL